MKEMTSRERVVTALEHRAPDRVPWDCTFSFDAYKKLRGHLGRVAWEDVTPGGPFLNIRPPFELVRELQIDLYYVGLNQPKGVQVFEAGMDAFTDEWGVKFKKSPMHLALPTSSPITLWPMPL